jgi:hypothetical protein
MVVGAAFVGTRSLTGLGGLIVGSTTMILGARR